MEGPYGDKTEYYYTTFILNTKKILLNFKLNRLNIIDLKLQYNIQF